MFSLLPRCYLRVSCGCSDGSRPSLVVVPCGSRVSAPWCACLQDRGTASSRLKAWGALSSVPRVSVHPLLGSGKPCKQLGLHSFAPAVCRAALSVLVCRLCPAEVTLPFRGTLEELEVMLGVPWGFVTSVVVTVHVRANLVIHTAVWISCSASCSTEYLRAAVYFISPNSLRPPWNSSAGEGPFWLPSIRSILNLKYTMNLFPLFQKSNI